MELVGRSRRTSPLGRCVVCGASTCATYADVALCLADATAHGERVIAYHDTLDRFWRLVGAGASADPSECRATERELARLMDDVGERLATRLRHGWARAYSERTAICPLCGERGPYHEPAVNRE